MCNDSCCNKRVVANTPECYHFHMLVSIPVGNKKRLQRKTWVIASVVLRILCIVLAEMGDGLDLELFRGARQTKQNTHTATLCMKDPLKPSIERSVSLSGNWWNRLAKPSYLYKDNKCKWYVSFLHQIRWQLRSNGAPSGKILWLIIIIYATYMGKKNLKCQCYVIVSRSYNWKQTRRTYFNLWILFV